IGLCDLCFVAASARGLDQVGMMMAKIDARDGADRIVCRNGTGKAMCGNAHAHAPLDDRQQRAASEVKQSVPHAVMLHGINQPRSLTAAFMLDLEMHQESAFGIAEL
ncbi:MAG: hypothetical protein JO002_02575, partial [Burkholderiaceae bacterium]|nr:hypothetical protein [Burkholderiaceae bacterium]